MSLGYEIEKKKFPLTCDKHCKGKKKKNTLQKKAASVTNSIRVGEGPWISGGVACGIFTLYFEL